MMHVYVTFALTDFLTGTPQAGDPQGEGNHVIQAAVYVPPDLERDFLYAREGIDHIDRHGYKFAGVFRDLEQVHQVLANGVSVIVFARQSHWDPEMRMPAEIVGDETRKLTWAIPPKDRLAERRPRPSVVGEQTVEIDKRPYVPLQRRPRNDRAAQIVECAARRMGFPPADDRRGWGPANY